jgi:hypothetical protein
MSVSVDTTEFQKALKLWMVNSKRELANALNMRMKYVQMRALLITPPRNPQTRRNQVRDQMNRVIEERGRMVTRSKSPGWKRWGRSRQYRYANMVAAVRQGKPGIGAGRPRSEIPKLLSEAAAKVRRGAIGSVGYLKAVIVLMLRGISGGRFTQFGGVINGKSKTKRVDVPVNTALVALAGQYQHEMANVGVHKRAKVDTHLAVPGINPVAESFASFGAKDLPNLGGPAKAEAIMQASFTQAFEDERKEMLQHIEATAINTAGDAGFTVR